jgi:hypothetical protein
MARVVNPTRLNVTLTSTLPFPIRTSYSVVSSTPIYRCFVTALEWSGLPTLQMCVGGVYCENCLIAKSVVHVQGNYRHFNVHCIYRWNHVTSFIWEFKETGSALNNLKGGDECKQSVRTDDTVLRVEEEYSKKEQVVQFLSSLKNLTLLATYLMTKSSDSIYRCFLTRYRFFQRWMITAKVIHVPTLLKGILVFWAIFALQMRSIRIRMESLSNKVKYGQQKIQTSMKKLHFINEVW